MFCFNVNILVGAYMSFYSILYLRKCLFQIEIRWKTPHAPHFYNITADVLLDFTFLNQIKSHEFYL